MLVQEETSIYLAAELSLKEISWCGVCALIYDSYLRINDAHCNSEE